MIHIFLSYRRTDTADATGRLYDNLRMKFGEELVFRDVYNIAVGIDWHEHIIETLKESDVVLAIIGPTWLAATDAKGRRRLDDPEDAVREELDLAIELSVPIIPVLVGTATMPARDDFPDSLKPLSRLNAARVRDTDFDHDFERLFQAIQKYARQKGEDKLKAIPERVHEAWEKEQAEKGVMIHLPRAGEGIRERASEVTPKPSVVPTPESTLAISTRRTALEIMERIRAARPYNRDEVAAAFVGQPYEETLFFSSASRIGSEKERMLVFFWDGDDKHSLSFVICDVPIWKAINTYRQRRKRIDFRVRGTIEKAGQYAINLRDASIEPISESSK